jgi:hypothetical protein
MEIKLKINKLVEPSRRCDQRKFLKGYTVKLTKCLITVKKVVLFNFVNTSCNIVFLVCIISCSLLNHLFIKFI